MGRQSGSAIGHVCSKCKAIPSGGVGPSLFKTKVSTEVAVVMLNGNAAAQMFPGVDIEPFPGQFVCGEVDRFIVCDSCSHVLEVDMCGIECSTETDDAFGAMCGDKHVVGKDAESHLVAAEQDDPRAEEESGDHHGEGAPLGNTGSFSVGLSKCLQLRSCRSVSYQGNGSRC